MKTLVSGVLAALAVTLCSGIAGAAESPVAVSHKITSYEKGAKTATVGYTLQVHNRTDKTLSKLALRIIPPPFLAGTPATLSVESLPAKGSTDLTIKFKAPAAVPEKFLSRQPLSMAGTCVNGDGAAIEFPVQSRSGGAK